MVMIPVHTRDTAGTGRGMSRVAKSSTRTHTRDTRDPKPAGFPVPVPNPILCTWQGPVGNEPLCQTGLLDRFTFHKLLYVIIVIEIDHLQILQMDQQVIDRRLLLMHWEFH